MSTKEKEEVLVLPVGEVSALPANYYNWLTPFSRFIHRLG